DATASREPEAPPRQHIIPQGEPGSLLRRLQEEPQLAVELLTALQEAVHDSQDKLEMMEEDRHGVYDPADIAAKRARLASYHALLATCVSPVRRSTPAPGAPPPRPS